MNYSEKAMSRIYRQYKDSPKLKAWVDILPELGQVNFEDPAQIIADILDIENRTGHQLDIIGRIVGINRPFIQLSSQGGPVYFSPESDLDFQFGDLGAEFSKSPQYLSETASDELFRLIIKSKIEKNNGRSTIDSIIRSARIISGVNQVSVTDNQNMTWEVVFDQSLNSTTRFALKNFDLLPRPQGTQFLGFIESPSLTQFGAEFSQFGDNNSQFNEVFI